MFSIRVLRTFTFNSLTLAILAASAPGYADDYFNLSALETDTPLENTGALAAYLHNSGLLPGNYLTSVVWDQEFIDKRNINFLLSKDGKKLVPQFTKAELRELGVKVDTVPALNLLDDNSPVGDISEHIPEARYDFSADTQVLQLRIPQMYRNTQISGDTNPKYWDDGIPALWTSYYISGSHQRFNGDESSSNWVSLNSGINLGPWRLHNMGTWGQDDGWQSINTSLQRDIKPLRSQFEAGQTSTNGELFDSVQMTGIKLETDTSMLPSSLQGFAPVVRGIANSDAKVTVKQNGYVIYQTNVSPGPFEIRDLSQVTAGADLEVTVQEADGTERSFIQASSSVPIMLREGAMKYSLAAGKYRDVDNGEEPGFGQATLIYGLPYGMTAYGGMLGASMYHSALVGMGVDLQQFGSLSTDVTAAKTAFNDDRDDARGQSWRAQYAKDFPLTDTTVTLASYRYSTSGFYTFQEALDQRNNNYDSDDIYSYRSTNNRRSRQQFSLSQSLHSWGSVYANAYQQDYWGMDGYERSISLGYSSSWQGINWSVNYNLTKTPSTTDDQQIAFSINVPLARWLSNSWATYNMNSTRHGNTSHQVGISGTLLEDNNLSYNLQQTYTNSDAGNGAYLSSRYRASVGEFSSSYSYQKDNKQWSYSAQGSVVAHSHGVTLGPSIQDAFAIVHIADGNNVKVQNSWGVYTDYWGNAVVPSLTNYRRNTITVNTYGRDDIDIQDSSLDVTPTKGAVVAADFTARAGKRALITLKRNHGVVPFGAMLSLSESTAIVGDDGEVYLTGLKGTQTFTVQWGDGREARCAGSVTIPEEVPAGIYKANVQCQ
ncbi:fimbrial biogenesis outer membrane usher protein [Citrobacter cronae]|uniref:fimbria/pilus outer membrane usher protein n=1 Tax=Citrobacter freundii complex TaxID=1344959 RepID=UPI000B40C610|nr:MULTISPECIES: fimbria/pilus outer membrane usher protein [Citrobacter]MBJ8363716.1 fimbrial biogenesis outer membrane usher protein [Citrobacter cronae]RNW21183.1 fimbrial biogenesis outer membrane usher protein [Citrobacter werkmanii]